MCEILTGRPPYSGNSAAEIIELAREGDCRQSIDLVRTNYDEIVASILERTLSRKVAHRFRDAGELATHLKFWFDTQKAREKQKEIQNIRKPFEKAKKFLVATIALLVAAGAIGLVWRWLEIREQRSSKQETITQELNLVDRNLSQAIEFLESGNLFDGATQLQAAESALKRIDESDRPEKTTSAVEKTKLLNEFCVNLRRFREERIMLLVEPELSTETFDKIASECTKLVDRCQETEEDSAFVKRLLKNLQLEVRFSPETPRIRDLVKILQPLVEPDELFPELKKDSTDAEIGQAVSRLKTELGPGVIDAAIQKVARKQTLMDAVFRADPNSFWGNLYGAFFYASRVHSNVDEQLKNRQKAIERAKNAFNLRRNSKLAAFVYAQLVGIDNSDELKFIVAGTPEETWVDFYVRARHSQSIGNFFEATKYLEKAIKLRGKDNFLTFLLATLQQSQGLSETAFETLNQLSGEYSKSSEVLHAKFLMSLWQLKPEFARARAKELNNLHPNSYLTNYTRLFLHFHNGRILEAKSLAEKIYNEKGMTRELALSSLLLELITGKGIVQGNGLELLKKDTGLSSFMWILEAIVSLNEGDLDGGLAALRSANVWLKNNVASQNAGIEVGFQVAMTSFVEPALEFLKQQVSDLQQQSKSKRLDAIKSSAAIPGIGTLTPYMADYLALTGDYPMAVEFYEILLPQDTVFDQFAFISKAPKELNQLFDFLNVDFSSSSTQLEIYETIRDRVNSLSPKEQEGFLQQIMGKLPQILELFGEIGASRPSIFCLFSNLRMSAARAAALAADGVRKGNGRLGTDAERNRWRELAIRWLTDEVKELEMTVKNLEQFPVAARFPIQQTCNFRVSFLLLHQDFASLRDESSLMKTGYFTTTRTQATVGSY